jgi:hypothetical protein
MSTDKPEEDLESRTGSSGMTSENDDQKWYERKVLTPAGYLIMLIGPLGVALGLSWQTPLAEATAVHWAVVFTVVGWAALIILTAIIIARNAAKDSNKTVAIATALVIAYVVLSGPTLLISAVGLVVTNIATGGTTVVHNPLKTRPLSVIFMSNSPGMRWTLYRLWRSPRPLVGRHR